MFSFVEKWKKPKLPILNPEETFIFEQILKMLRGNQGSFHVKFWNFLMSADMEGIRPNSLREDTCDHYMKTLAAKLFVK